MTLPSFEHVVGSIPNFFQKLLHDKKKILIHFISYQEHQEHLTKQTPLDLFSLMYWSITTHLLLPSPTHDGGV